MNNAFETVLGRHALKLVRGTKFVWVKGQWPGDGHVPTIATPKELLHEVGHFIVAPKSRRRAMHFGLGDPNNDYEGNLSEKARDFEECMALVIEYALTAEFTRRVFKFSDVHMHIDYTFYDVNSIDTAISLTSALEDLGFVSRKRHIIKPIVENIRAELFK